MTATLTKKSPITNAGPIVVQFKTPAGAELYHVAGKGEVAESIRDATRYEVDPGGKPLKLDPFPTYPCLPICLALIEVVEVTYNYVRVRWGEEEVIVPPHKLHAATYCPIRHRLNPFVRIGGGPYGSTVLIDNPHKERETAALFDVGFILPGDTGELVNVSNPRGSKPFPILPAGDDPLGLTWNHLSPLCENSSEWFRLLNRCSLHLDSGFGGSSKSIRLESADHVPIRFTLPKSSFAAVHPRLVEFIPRAEESEPSAVRELFISLFSDLS
ncbi:MAG: hypothetical protein OSA84_12735 [Akkermansiaceae bacterium]|nr:hypothetical protein [Akkermansiaceae bacterium]